MLSTNLAVVTRWRRAVSRIARGNAQQQGQQPCIAWYNDDKTVSTLSKCQPDGHVTTCDLLPDLTVTAGKFLPKWPRPEEEDPISDIEDDLQVMDTPTSSQQDWGMDEEMADADDEVEIIDSSIPMERISSTGPSSRDESPDIPIDRLSVAGTEGQILVSPAANDWHKTNTSSNWPNPHPAMSLPLEYQDDLHE